MMDPAEIAAAYDGLAEQWSSEAFPRDYGIAQHERAIAFLKEKRRALDIGCGSSGRIIELLTGRGFEAEGVDISPRMVELAKARHPQVKFHRADIRRWAFPGKYDVISAWDSIWHLPLADQR